MTANEIYFLKKFAPQMKAPTLNVGSAAFGKAPNARTLFPEGHEYLGVDLEIREGVDEIHDMETPLEGKFNSIICTSVLEHAKRPWLIAENISTCLNSGGHLFVAAPFVWRYHDYPCDYYRYTTDAFKILFPDIQWSFLKYATQWPKEIFDTYEELSSVHKKLLSFNTTASAVSIGFGIKG